VEIINNFLTQLVESILDHQGVRVAVLMMLIASGQVWSSNETSRGLNLFLAGRSGSCWKLVGFGS
jgi:hypothetical protein